jgi:hypothetical protein
VHSSAKTVDFYHRASGVQRDAVFVVPFTAVQNGLFEPFLSSQNRRKKNAVVVGMGLVTEYRNGIFLWSKLHQLLQGTHTGHSVADQNQCLFHI